MKRSALSFALVCLIPLWCHGQTPIKITTAPKLPNREALDRMNLTVAWHARVHVDGTKDGVASVQILPGKSNQILVQTYKGGVFLYDADRGDLIWKTQVGVPYWAPQPAGFNSHSIFVTRRKTLHVLNRFDGAQRVFTYYPRLKHYEFGYELLHTPNAGLVVDEESVYISMGERMNAIFVPNFGLIDAIKARREQLRKEGKPLPVEDAAMQSLDPPQPEFAWGYRFGSEFTTSSALVHGEQVSLLTAQGTLVSLARFGKNIGAELFEFKAIGKTPGLPTQHQNMAYFGSDDFNLYAVDMDGGRLVWRYASGAPILRGPNVNDRDVFVSPERIGLRRIDRNTGREVWTNRDSHQFLAANDAYVYALDRHGRFNVVDSRRGTTLATHDLSDWTISLANEWTDRIYLAANDGQVMCLHRKDLARPMIMKTAEKPRVPVEKQPMEEKKNGEEKEKAQRPLEESGPTKAMTVWRPSRHFSVLAAIDRRHWAIP